jgi:hypothetical protein
VLRIQIWDSCIPKQQQKRRGGKNVMNLKLIFFVATIFTKIVNYLISEQVRYRKKFGPVDKEVGIVLLTPKIITELSKTCFLRSRIWKKPIPDPEVKRAPDPGPATLNAFHCPFLIAGAAAVTPSSGSSWSRRTGWAMRPPPQRIRTAARRGDRWAAKL